MSFPGLEDDHRHHWRAIAFAAMGDRQALKSELARALDLGLWLPPRAKLVPELLQHEGKDPELDRLFQALRLREAPRAR